jgi:ABC-2 type transport system permease protein
MAITLYSRKTLYPSLWYNNTLNYKTNGAWYFSAISNDAYLVFIGYEYCRKRNTLEQINVTPIKKHQFIIGKLFPFWVLGLMLLSVGLLIARLVFRIPILGNIGLIYPYHGVFTGYTRHRFVHF